MLKQACHKSLRQNEGQVGVQRLDIKVDQNEAIVMRHTAAMRREGQRGGSVLGTIWMLKVITLNRSRWIAKIFVLSLHAEDLCWEPNEDRWALMWVDFVGTLCHSSGCSDRMDKLMSLTAGMTQILR